MQIFTSFLNFNNNSNISFTAKPIPPAVAGRMELKMLKANNIDIFCHAFPDEDTFNSAKVLAKWLISKNKNVRLIVEDKLRGIYVSNLDRQIISAPANLKDFTNGDLAVVVDCNSMLRISESGRELLKKYKKQQILGFDHHQLADREDLIGNVHSINKNPFYVDKSAKSCSAIIYRFFERLGVELDQDSLSSLYCGMIDDLSKSGCVEIENKHNVYKAAKSDKIDKHTAVILKNIEKKLSPVKLKEVLKHLDILSNLTTAEKSFQKKLFNEKINFTENGNFAYVEIPYNDKEWIKLGQDNIVTNKILSNFRQRILLNSPNDKMILDNIRPQLEQIKGIVVFYRGPKSSNNKQEFYKFSMHVKKESAQNLIEKINAEMSSLKAGGHPDRFGGKIYPKNIDECEKFVKTFLDVIEEKLPLNKFEEIDSVTSEFALSNT